LSLLKTINLTERFKMRFGAQVANVFNHPNFAVPGNLTVGVPVVISLSTHPDSI
jgi:hypothetical protein